MRDNIYVLGLLFDIGLLPETLRVVCGALREINPRPLLASCGPS
jgi:hypothetical protein